jgi:hypothetical protein
MNSKCTVMYYRCLAIAMGDSDDAVPRRLRDPTIIAWLVPAGALQFGVAGAVRSGTFPVGWAGASIYASAYSIH